MDNHDYRIVWDGLTLRLPPGDGSSSGLPLLVIPEVGEARQNLEHLRKQRSAGRTLDARLIPRPENPYSPLAISVALPGVKSTDPDQYFSQLDSRHVAYVREWPFRDCGGLSPLHVLARYSADELGCTLRFIGGELRLDAPEPEIVAQAVRQFIDDPRNTHPDELPRLHADATSGGLRPAVPTTLSSQGRNSHRASITGMLARTVTVSGNRFVRLFQRPSGQSLGFIRDGILVPDDERDRHRILELGDFGDAVVSSLDDPLSAQGLFPRLKARWPLAGYYEEREITFHTVLSDGSPHPDACAIYRSSNRSLRVEASQMAEVCYSYAARLGLIVDIIRFPGGHWEPTSAGTEHDWKEKRWPSGRQHNFSTLVEVHDPQRRMLFGDFTLMSERQPCRTCKSRSHPLFTTPLCTEPLAYCSNCLMQAHNGPGRRAATDGIRELIRLSELEFSGKPIAQIQLTMLNINPATPVAAETVDELIKLRQQIPRGRWDSLLQKSGLLVGQRLRRARGYVVQALDGHLCASMLEKVVCDYLHRNQIPHTKEPHYPIDPLLNPTGRMRADWLLPDSTYVEMWGLPGDLEYSKRMNDKQELTKRLGLRLIELYAEDLIRLDSLLGAFRHKDSDQFQTVGSDPDLPESPACAHPAT